MTTARGREGRKKYPLVISFVVCLATPVFILMFHVEHNQGVNVRIAKCLLWNVCFIAYSVWRVHGHIVGVGEWWGRPQPVYTLSDRNAQRKAIE